MKPKTKQTEKPQKEREGGGQRKDTPEEWSWNMQALLYLSLLIVRTKCSEVTCKTVMEGGLSYLMLLWMCS